MPLINKAGAKEYAEADIDGIIDSYKVAAGGTISAGDFVEFVTSGGDSGTFGTSFAVPSNYVKAAVQIDENRVVAIVQGTAYVLTISSGNVVKNSQTTVASNVGKLAACLICDKTVAMYHGAGTSEYDWNTGIEYQSANTYVSTFKVNDDNSITSINKNYSPNNIYGTSGLYDFCIVKLTETSFIVANRSGNTWTGANQNAYIYKHSNGSITGKSSHNLISIGGYFCGTSSSNKLLPIGTDVTGLIFNPNTSQANADVDLNRVYFLPHSNGTVGTDIKAYVMMDWPYYDYNSNGGSSNRNVSDTCPVLPSMSLVLYRVQKALYLSCVSLREGRPWVGTSLLISNNGLYTDPRIAKYEDNIYILDDNGSKVTCYRVIIKDPVVYSDGGFSGDVSVELVYTDSVLETKNHFSVTDKQITTMLNSSVKVYNLPSSGETTVEPSLSKVSGVAISNSSGGLVEVVTPAGVGGSTSHTWNRYKVSYGAPYTNTYVKTVKSSGSGDPAWAQYTGSSFTFDQSTGIYSVEQTTSNRGTYVGNHYYLAFSNTQGSLTSYTMYQYAQTNGATAKMYKGVATATRGELVDAVTSQNADAYPDNGIQNFYWYEKVN